MQRGFGPQLVKPLGGKAVQRKGDDRGIVERKNRQQDDRGIKKRQIEKRVYAKSAALHHLDPLR